MAASAHERKTRSVKPCSGLRLTITRTLQTLVSWGTFTRSSGLVCGLRIAKCVSQSNDGLSAALRVAGSRVEKHALHPHVQNFTFGTW